MTRLSAWFLTCAALCAPTVAAAAHPPVPKQFTGTWVEARVSCKASEEVYETVIDQDGVYTEAVEAKIVGVRVATPTAVDIDTLVSFDPPARGTTRLTLSRNGQRMTMQVIADGSKPLTHEPSLALKRCAASQ